MNRSLRIQRESHFHRDLPMFDGGLVDVAANLSDFEPAQIVQRSGGALKGVVHGVLHRSGRSAGEFDDFVNVIVHNPQNIPHDETPAIVARRIIE